MIVCPARRCVRLGLGRGDLDQGNDTTRHRGIPVVKGSVPQLAIAVVSPHLDGPVGFQGQAEIAPRADRLDPGKTGVFSVFSVSELAVFVPSPGSHASVREAGKTVPAACRDGRGRGQSGDLNRGQ